MWRKESEPTKTSVLKNGGFEAGLNEWISCSDTGTTKTVSDPSEGDLALQVSNSDCLYQEFPILPETTYVLKCEAKSDSSNYSSLALTMMSSSYENLAREEVEITSAGYQAFTSTVTAPAAGSIGAVTFYSDGTALFDNCQVVATTHTAPPGPPVENSLLVNGGFESALTNWYSCSTDGATEIVSDATQGSSALKIAGGDCLYQEFSVKPNARYSLRCDAKGTQALYTSVSLTMMDEGYANLALDEVEISSAEYQTYTSTVDAPEAGVFGAVTFYSEDTGVFDNCTVVEE